MLSVGFLGFQISTANSYNKEECDACKAVVLYEALQFKFHDPKHLNKSDVVKVFSISKPSVSPSVFLNFPLTTKYKVFIKRSLNTIMELKFFGIFKVLFHINTSNSRDFFKYKVLEKVFF